MLTIVQVTQLSASLGQATATKHRLHHDFVCYVGEILQKDPTVNLQCLPLVSC
jgi:hypothetical protein